MAQRLKTPLFGVDGTEEISVSVLRAHGVRFVHRYLSRSEGKVITKGEYQRYKAAGIGVTVCFEDGALNSLGGHAQGMADAEFALKQAHDRMGTPVIPRPCNPTTDFDPAEHPADITDPYYDAWGQVWTRALCGPYGGKSLVSRQIDRGFGQAWQTYAWSHHELDTRARQHQFLNEQLIGGHDVDFDHAYYADYGQWNISRPDPYARFEDVWRGFTRDSLKSLKLYQQIDNTFKGPVLRLRERHVVERLDTMIKQGGHATDVHTHRLWAMILRKRIWYVSHFDPATGLPRHKVDWSDGRGWRWGQLNDRTKGFN